MTTSPPDYTTLRAVILILAMVGAVSWGLWGKRCRMELASIAVMLWLINVSMFHLFRLFHVPFATYTYNTWSLGIQLQACLTLAALGVYLARERVGCGYGS